MSTTTDLSRYHCTAIARKAFVPTDGRPPIPDRICGAWCMPGDPSLCQKHGGRDVRFVTSAELKSRGWTTKQIEALPAHDLAPNPHGGFNKMRRWLAPIVMEIEQGRRILN